MEGRSSADASAMACALPVRVCLGKTLGNLLKKSSTKINRPRSQAAFKWSIIFDFVETVASNAP
jgi:hypothetical protein